MYKHSFILNKICMENYDKLRWRARNSPLSVKLILLGLNCLHYLNQTSVAIVYSMFMTLLTMLVLHWTRGMGES